jgi:hypothetical protein
VKSPKSRWRRARRRTGRAPRPSTDPAPQTAIQKQVTWTHEG